MTLTAILKREEARSLPPSHQKILVELFFIADDQLVVKNFSVRSLVKQWSATPQKNLCTSRNTLAKAINDLQAKKLISFDKKTGSLKIHH